MVTSIARQSVIIKCNMQKSVLTGNYEFYYAAGLIAKLSGVEISDDIKPIELGVLFCLRRMTLWINFSAFAHLMFWLNCFVWWLVVPWFFLPYIFLLLE